MADPVARGPFYGERVKLWVTLPTWAHWWALGGLLSLVAPLARLAFWSDLHPAPLPLSASVRWLLGVSLTLATALLGPLGLERWAVAPLLRRLRACLDRPPVAGPGGRAAARAVPGSPRRVALAYRTSREVSGRLGLWLLPLAPVPWLWAAAAAAPVATGPLAATLLGYGLLVPLCFWLAAGPLYAVRARSTWYRRLEADRHWLIDLYRHHRQRQGSAAAFAEHVGRLLSALQAEAGAPYAEIVADTLAGDLAHATPEQARALAPEIRAQLLALPWRAVRLGVVQVLAAGTRDAPPGAGPGGASGAAS